MANKAADRLFEEFLKIAGKTGAAIDEPQGNGAVDGIGPEAAVQATAGVQEAPAARDVASADSAQSDSAGTLGASFNAAAEAGGAQSYHGTSGSSQRSGSQGASTLNQVEAAAKSVLGSGLGLVPLAENLLGLFGIGGSAAKAKPTFEKYAMPGAINFSAAESGSGLSDADYDQMGMPRTYGGTQPMASSVNSPSAGAGSGSTGTSGAAAAPQISVNVQAMDARSFMDYSGEIAKAVRDAMLNLSSINDVVTEL